jgi:hypothetical protein
VWKSQHWGIFEENQCLGVFADRNVPVMQNFLGSPKWIENMASAHLHHSHLPSKVTKQSITSPPVQCLHIVYSLYFYTGSLSFRHQQLRDVPVQGVLKATVWILYSDHRETALFRGGQQQRVTVRTCSSSLYCYPPCLMCTELKWSCISVECEHNPDKAT